MRLLALGRDEEPEHPWIRERRKSKVAVARETIIKLHLRAALERRELPQSRCIPEAAGSIQIIMTSAPNAGDHGFA